MAKRFTKNDEGFVCVNCGFTALPLGKTSRNHCPRCLCSLHVDVLPGDRACSCHGVLRPVSAEPDARKGFVIYYKCEKCGFTGRNRAAIKEDASDALPDEQYDDKNLLIALTVNRYI